jgi:hypothetical protein
MSYPTFHLLSSSREPALARMGKGDIGGLPWQIRPVR